MAVGGIGGVAYPAGTAKDALTQITWRLVTFGGLECSL